MCLIETTSAYKNKFCLINSRGHALKSILSLVLQEKTMKTYKACNAEVIFYSYGIGLIISFCFLLISGDLVSGFNAFSNVGWWQSYGHALVFSLTGYCGMNCVLSLVRSFGAFMAVSVTSMRKFVSVALSFIIFSKPFSIQYLVSRIRANLIPNLITFCEGPSFKAPSL